MTISLSRFSLMFSLNSQVFIIISQFTSLSLLSLLSPPSLNPLSTPFPLQTERNTDYQREPRSYPERTPIKSVINQQSPPSRDGQHTQPHLRPSSSATLSRGPLLSIYFHRHQTSRKLLISSSLQLPLAVIIYILFLIIIIFFILYVVISSLTAIIVLS